MGTFSFREDIRKVQWGRTLWLSLLRCFAAGIVWGAVMLYMSFYQTPDPGAPPWWSMPLVLPLAYLFALPCWFIAAKLMTTFGGGLGELGVGLTSILLGLALAVGDPLVFILKKLNLSAVPTEKFWMVNPAMVIFVLDPAKV